MEPRLQLRVQRYGWDRAAPHYDALWQRALAPATEALLARAALQPGERVLDVACGTGVLTERALAAVGPGGSVVATDLSEAMLAATAARAPGARCVHANAEVLDEHVPPADFDAVLCGLGLMYLPAPERAIAAMRRCLRPGGRLVVSVWGERSACGWAEVFPIVDARVRSEVCPLFFRLGSGDALASALRAAGLHGVTLARVATELVYATADEASDAALIGGPVALAVSRFDAATLAAVRAEYLASIAPWRRGDGYAVPGVFVVAAGSAG